MSESTLVYAVRKLLQAQDEAAAQVPVDIELLPDCEVLSTHTTPLPEVRGSAEAELYSLRWRVFFWKVWPNLFFERFGETLFRTFPWVFLGKTSYFLCILDGLRAIFLRFSSQFVRKTYVTLGFPRGKPKFSRIFDGFRTVFLRFSLRKRTLP